MMTSLSTVEHLGNIVVRKHNENDIDIHCKALREEYGKIARHSSHIIKSIKLLGTDGWLTAEVDGKPVGFIGCVLFNKEYAMIGFYIVEINHRGKGVGKALWNAATQQCGDRNIAVYAENTEMYFNKGLTEISGGCYGCIGQSLEKTHPLPPAPDGYRIVKYTGDEEQLRLISNYDDNITPIPRHKFLEYYLNPEAVTTYMVMVHDSKLAGYATIQPIDTGFNSYAIGPFYADSDQVAETLLISLLKVPPSGAMVSYDPIKDNVSSINLMTKYDFSISERYCLVSTSTPDFIPSKRVYGILSSCISIV